MLTCSHPLRAYQAVSARPNEPTFLCWSLAEAEKAIGYDSRGLPRFKVVYLPCGHCVPCRLAKAREWATRCYHELLTCSSGASFLTLTYNNDNLPDDKCVSNRTHQLFMKRLRKALPGVKIRFFMCAEYGEKYCRPHYHYIIFGYDFPDKKPWKNSHTGHPMCRSALLERLWTFGYSTVQRVTYETCQYVARYVLKKAHGRDGEKWYEVNGLVPEFCRCSNRPGIGHDWLLKYYASDVRGRDRVPVLTDKGIKQFSLPRYYVKIMREQWPQDYVDYKLRQLEEMAKREALDRLEAERQGFTYEEHGVGYCHWCKFQADQALEKARNAWKGSYRHYEKDNLTQDEQHGILKADEERVHQMMLFQPEIFL